MADAFLHRRSIFDKHKDSYGLKNLIKQRRVARSWDNPITRNKRERSLNDWASSFAGKRHYRKLSRHNALHLHEEVESLGIPAVYSGSTLTLADGSVVTGISPGIRGKCSVTINAVREGDFIRLIPDWDEQGNFFKREVHFKYELDYTNHGTKYDHSIAYLNDLGALAHHEAFHLCEDVDMNRVSIEEICDTLNHYAAARWLPFKADLLHGADGKHISLHSGNTYLDIGYAPSGELEVYDAEVAHPLNVLTHWDSVDEIAGHLLSLAVQQAAKNESVYEKLSFEKGHKDSKGNDAPWVIHSHEDGKVLASFANKDDAVQHLARMKNYSKRESFMSLKSALRESHAKKLESFARGRKDEGKFTEIKAAIKAAWSAAEAKWFRLDFQESTERLDVYPITSDNGGVGVNWGVLPERSTIVQYATDFRTGNSEIEREMPYKDLDELEKIFVDEFKAMDETLEVDAENGADIHPLTEKSEGAASFSHVWELQAQQAKETLEELTKRFGDADRLAFEIRNFPHTQECDVAVTIDGNPFITVEFEGGRHSGIRWHCFDDDVDDMRLDAGDENAAKSTVLHFKDDILDALESLYGFGAIADEGT